METAALHLEINEIEYLLSKIFTFVFQPEVASIHQKLEHAKQTIDSSRKKLIVNPEIIISKVCDLTGFTRDQIIGKRGSQTLCDTRACISALIYTLCPKISKSSIRHYINRDHATVHHHLWMVENCNETKFLFESLKSKIVI